jgi:polyhydroxyalkanoate synthesis regulator phasin
MVLLTRDRIRETVRRHAGEIGMRREDAERLIDELYRSGEDRWTALEERSKRAVRSWLKTFDLARESELHALREQVANLEKRLKILESMQRGDGRRP